MKLNTYIWDDVPVTVEYWYQPFEPANLTYPGCDAEVTIQSVRVMGEDILSGLSEELIYQLGNECLTDAEEEK